MSHLAQKGLQASAFASAIALQLFSFPALSRNEVLVLPSGMSHPVASQEVPIKAAHEKIKDKNGRTRYIVDLIDDHQDKPAIFSSADSKIAWYKFKSNQLISDVTTIRGIEVFSLTSLVGTSFTAYLDDKQVEQLSNDKRTKLISEDSYLQHSALWTTTTDPSGQIRPWGLQAMGTANGGGTSNGFATVYILDTGVEIHSDLPGLNWADRISALNVTASGQPINPTGCYSHATHVAGIIGAADNGQGVVGVLPGVRLVSIAVGDTNPSICPSDSSTVSGSTGGSASAFVAGLEIIYQRVLQDGRVGIVNISFNKQPEFPTNDFRAGGTIGMKMQTVATPNFFEGAGYRGAFIVQSAGNSLQDSCAVAYDAPSATDGIMVVGGLDANGHKVVPFNYLGLQNGFSSQPLAADEPGSNTGNCVEVWAPSQRVYSTWTANSYAFLSGTSMAAPHVAGLAARLLETSGSISTSVELEAAVRAHINVIAGSGLYIPKYLGSNETAKPTIEIAFGFQRASVDPINFYSNPVDAFLRYEAIGANSCNIYVTRNGAYYSLVASQPTAGNLWASSLDPGQYSWSITCISPQGSQSTAVASGYIRRIVSYVYWDANTYETNFNWVQLSPGQTIRWMNADGATGNFAQRYRSDGDFCQVKTYGAYIGVGYSYIDPYWLWDSGDHFPANLEFIALNFHDPSTVGPKYYDGYMWRVRCWNTDGNEITKEMWGTPFHQ